MVALIVSVLVVFALLCVSEVLWRHRKEVDPEYTRKFVHITVGSFVAFWPLFLDHLAILLLSLGFVVVILLTQAFHVFDAIRSVQRPTSGEIFFALSVGTLAYIAQDGWIYMAALLHMSMADGLAAIIGTKFGHTTRYYVSGHPKSLAGTGTFVVVSLAILSAYALFTPHSFSLWFIPIALGTAAIENVAIRGLDNLVVPVVVALSLNLLH